MKINMHRFYKNREAVIKGAALLLDILLTIACMVGALWMRYDFKFSQIDPVSGSRCAAICGSTWHARC